MVLITAAAILGFWAGASLLAVQQCVNNPSLCQSNTTYPTYYYYWSYGPGVVVNTGSGQLRGVTWTSRMGRRFYSFLGVPYAEIPMRFEVSRPFPRWDGIRDASNYGSMCLQLDRKSQIITGSENCLFLNIFTPKCNSNAQLPVMIWIDSSLGWETGSGDKINPRNFMDENIVLVTFNFRLSALGFLSTSDGEIQGNMGLKDQVLALQWVRSNIRNFGGNPDSITIAGQDSGAASVHLHMLSPLSKGLFQKGISQGGSAHCPWAMQKNPASKTKLLAQALNCDSPITKTMADCLRFKSGYEILHAQIKMKMPSWNGMEPYGTFAPTVEKIAYKSQPFLNNSPHKIIASGQIPNNVPWLVGFNEQEGRYFVDKVLNNDMLSNDINIKWNQLAPTSFFYDDLTTTPQSSRDSISSKIKNFYFPNNKRIGRDNWENYTNIYTDRYYLNGIAESIKSHAALAQGQVFPYVMKFMGDFSYTPMIIGDYSYRRLPSHYDELHYLFNWEWSMVSNNTGSWDLYQEFSKKFVKLWVSFAETGIPKGWGTTPNWIGMSPLSSFINWHEINYDTKVTTEDIYKTRMDFWKSSGVKDDIFVS